MAEIKQRPKTKIYIAPHADGMFGVHLGIYSVGGFHPVLFIDDDIDRLRQIARAIADELGIVFAEA